MHYNPIKKEDNLHVQYLIDSAVLAIVRTTNSILKFDSSASFKIMPRLETFSGFEPGQDKIIRSCVVLNTFIGCSEVEVKQLKHINKQCQNVSVNWFY